MMNLTLLSKLQAVDTVTLHLRSTKGGILEYYIISRSVVSDVVCFGQTVGEMSAASVTFNIRLSSIIPLINKGYDLEVRYSNGQLSFGTADKRISIKPLYVEFRDKEAEQVIARFIEFSECFDKMQNMDEKRSSIEAELSNLRSRRRDIVLNRMSLPFSDTNAFTGSGGPFGDIEETVSDENDKRYAELISKQEEALEELDRDAEILKVLDLSSLKNLAYAASRTHNVIDLCSDYGIVGLTNSYLLQKTECPIQSIQGQLLHTLLSYSKESNFYLFHDDLVFMTGGKDKTVVFIAKYLPNNSVDSTIVTRGIVEEKYKVELRSILDIIPLVRSKFPKFAMDMANGVFELSNELGETISYGFDVPEADSKELSKLKRGIGDASKLVMSKIEIPAEVQGLLPLFRSELVVYVKRNKIIFQNKNLYLVFGR